MARVLLGKAEGDLAAARLLAGDEHQSDHVVGFHAQQAVEKAIKAVLVSREVEIPLTHDIGYLVKLCVEVDELPEDVAGARWLTPWAGGWRYDTDDSPIDRGAAVAVAEAAVTWGRSLLQAG
ncbi:MAG: HEPN domain-containing protein [Solirubrobacteraceae bacterium]